MGDAKSKDLIPDNKNLKVIPIEKLDGRYFVDEFGNVYSDKGKNNSYKLIKQHVAENGYIKVNITHNSKNINLLIHRIVALTFINKPDGKDFVNHKNGIKSDNSVSNLEWVTILENAQHGRRMGLIVGVPHTEETKRKMSAIQRSLNSGGNNSKKVINTITGETFKTIKEAAKNAGFNYSHFVEMLSGRIKNNSNYKIFNGEETK